MLGVYERFPELIHKTTVLFSSVSNKKLQQTLVQMLHGLNSENLRLEEVAYPSIPQCTTIFEFGIAEASNFNYLDEEETNRLLKTIHKTPFQIMDFLCDIRYYKTRNEKKIPLRFDYYIIRFKFTESQTEMQIFHEKGSRYITPEDITKFIVNRINGKSAKKMLKAFDKL